ncbi:MAG TPA: hypothetical protein VNM43_04410 [Dehalococcoidia bacterium]|nr:hypothetical protein [Dehalococcoidia bacterium]
MSESMEGVETFRQLDRLPDAIGEVISNVLEDYARGRGLELIAWYHDLPIWMLEAKPQDHRVRRIQVSACRDRNENLALVATADMYELGPDGAVARVVRSLPRSCVENLVIAPSPWWLPEMREVQPEAFHHWRAELPKALPEMLDRVWKAAEAITEKDLEPIGARR